MTRNKRVLIVGLAALAVLGGAMLLLVVLPSKEPDPEPSAAPGPAALVEETYLSVKNIIITLEDGDSYNISPIPGDTVDYKMNTPPGAFPWYMPRVRDTGQAALRITPDEIVEENANAERLRAYGLDQPVSRVKLERVDGTGAEVLIGRMAPTGAYYAMKAGTDTVSLIRSYTGERLMRTSDELRDYTLFKTYTVQDENGDDVQDVFIDHFKTLSITGRDGTVLEVGRYTEDEVPPEGVVRVNRFYLTQPVSVDAHDFSLITTVLERILTVKAERVYAKAPGDWSVYGLDAPHILTIRDEEGWELELHIGDRNAGEDGGRFLRVAGTDYVLLGSTSADYGFLNQEPFYLRATTAWGRFYDIVGLDEILYEYGGRRLTQWISAFAPDDDRPVESALDGAALSEDTARRLYLRLLEIRLDGPYTDALPDTEPDAVFTLRMKDGAEHSLAAYLVNGGRHYAIVYNDENQMAYVEASKINRVFEALETVEAGGELTE